MKFPLLLSCRGAEWQPCGCGAGRLHPWAGAPLGGRLGAPPCPPRCQLCATAPHSSSPSLLFLQCHFLLLVLHLWKTSRNYHSPFVRPSVVFSLDQGGGMKRCLLPPLRFIFCLPALRPGQCVCTCVYTRRQ